MSDRIAVMRDGRIVQIGTPEEIYTRPVNRFVAEFMGEVNVFPVRRRPDGVYEGNERRRHLPGGGRDRAGGLHRGAAGVHAPARRAAGRRERRRRRALQLLFARVAHAVSGARRREGAGRRAVARGRRRPPTSIPAWSSAGTAATRSSSRAEPWRRRTSRRIRSGRLRPRRHAGRGCRPARAARCPSSRCWPLGFLAPLLAILGFSFATPRGFDAFRTFTLANYAAIFDPANTVWMSFAWSLALAAATVAILLVVAYPIAYGLARVFGRWAALVSLLFVFPLFVSENIRLYGWILFFIKGGVLDGTLKAAGLPGGPDVLFSVGATLFGMVYVYLPFMLFPMTLGLSTVPRDLIEAARDMGASRLQTWREVELPLAMPGILIGMLLTFVLAVGAVAEVEDPRRPVDHRHHPRHRDRLHLRAELAARLGARGAPDARRRRADLRRHRPPRPRPHPGAALMPAERDRRRDRRLRLGLDRLRRRGDLPADPLRRPRLARQVPLLPLPGRRVLPRLVAAHRLLHRDRPARPHLAEDGRGRHRSSPSSSPSSARSPTPATTGAAAASTRSSCCCRSSSRSR